MLYKLKPPKVLIANISWMLVSEVFARLSRLVTLFVLAAYFSNTQYGTAMLALVCHELLRVFTRLGTGAKIIQCKHEDLKVICQNAATLQWLVALSIAALQIIFSNTIAQFYHHEQLAELLQIMAISHIIYPIVTVKIFQLQRQNKLRYYGIASGLCIAFENLLVALLVFLDMGIYAVAYCKIFAAIVWVMLFFKLSSISSTLSWHPKIMRELINFSGKILGSEMLKSLRFQTDSLFAARLLTPELFGLYSFAKSAGLGIAQSLNLAYITAIYPYLCEMRRQDKWHLAQQQSYLFCGLLTGIFIIQALCASVYIEWLFDTRWLDAISIVSVLCLVAIPSLFIDNLTIQLRVNNQPNNEFIILLMTGLSLVVVLLLFQASSPLAIAQLYMVTSFSWLMVFVLMRLPFFGRQPMGAHS